MGVVVLKELIFNSSYVGKSVVVLKELIFYIYIIDLMVWLFTVSTLGECGGLEGTVI